MIVLRYSLSHFLLITFLRCIMLAAEPWLQHTPFMDGKKEVAQRDPTIQVRTSSSQLHPGKAPYCVEYTLPACPVAGALLFEHACKI